MANAIYNIFKKNVGIGDADWDDNTTSTFKMMLVTSTYVPDIDTHTVRSDVTNEVVGTGYTAGGVAIPNRTVTLDLINDRARFFGDNIQYPSVTITARAGVIYKDTGNPATDPLLLYIDFGSDKVATGANFDIVWSANGIFSIGG